MRTHKYIYATIFCLLMFAAQAWAQTTVSGSVADTDGNPLPGVSVVVKGTSTGTATGTDGKFTLNLPNDNARTLVFSFMGYEPMEAQITGTMLHVRLRESEQSLEDVVVVGYGTMRKSDLTGSLSSVKISEIEASQVTSFDKMLHGKAAGVQVTTGSAAPGGTVNIVIRGMNSFVSSEPLYVVDGIILAPASQDVSNAMGSSSGQESQNALSSINPQDIASMEILKDASATAIYGSLGANGVILITTKRGASDTPRIEWTSSFEISQPTKKIPVLDLDGFIAYSEAVGARRLSADSLSAVNWQDYTMRTALSQTHRLSVSGRGKNNNYYIAAGYLDNKGIMKNTDVSQADVRINFDQSVGKALKFGTKFTLTNRVNNMTQGTEPGGTQNAQRATNMMRQMLGSKPYLLTAAATSYDEEHLVGTDIWLNNYDDVSKEYRINGVVYAELKLLKKLSFKTTFGLDYRNKNRTRWYGQYIDSGRLGRGGISELNSFRYNVDNVLTYSSKFSGGHRLDAMVGTTVNYNINRNTTIEGYDFPDYPESPFRAGGLTTARSVTHWYGDTESSLLSYFTRLLYNYRERYILTATFRADGSSMFGEGNKFSYFPSLAFAWRASEETFLKHMKAVSNLKLRLGWGMVGNQSIIPYQTLATYTSNKLANPNSIYTLPNYNGQFLTGVKPARLSNSGLKWETTEQYNVGIDLSLLSNRINFTIDAYNKHTKDLLQPIEIPPSNGFSTQYVNMGLIENRGVEFTLDVIPVQNKDFTWIVGGNISFNRNKIIDVGLPESRFGTVFGAGFTGSDVSNTSDYFRMPANLYIEGKPMGMFYGFATKGLVSQEAMDADRAARNAYKEQWEAANPGKTISLNECKGTLPTYRTTVMTAGDINYLDTNGDGNIDDNDKCLLGDPNPKFIYGFSTSFSYKNLTLSVNFAGSYGNQVVNANLLQETDTAPSNPASNINNIRAEAFWDAWSAENPNAYYPRLRKTTGMASDFTDRIIEDGSYLRISTITLNYRIPLRSKVVKNLGVSFTARNPWIWTSYSGWDPDVSSFSASTRRLGVDWMSYPASRAWIFGLNATF